MSLKECHELVILLLLAVEGSDLEVEVVTELLLEERGRAANLELTTGDYSDTIGQELSLIHVVSSQNDDLILFGLLDNLPSLPSSSGIHTGGRLIKQDDL